MQIGAIGASTFTPYIYNTNMISRASMNKIQGIGDDLLDTKTDFSALSSETTNPLKRGESLDFAGILGMQMQMGRLNAARMMVQPKEEDAQQVTQAAGVASPEQVAQVAQVQEVESSAQTEQTASAFDYAKAMAAYQPINLFA